MARAGFAALALCLLSVAACNKQSPAPDGAGARGRYVGVGIFPASELWREMIVKDQQQAEQAAATRDDSHIIVVVDSQSGEIRECGEMSGRCVSMNPWTKAIAREQTAPVALGKHDARSGNGVVVSADDANVSDEAEESTARK